MDQSEDSCLAHFPHRAWHTDIHRQPEERVNGITTCEDSSHTSWSQCDKLLIHHLLHLAEEGGLTRSCPTGQEETTVRVGYQFESHHLLLVLCVDHVLHCLCVLHHVSAVQVLGVFGLNAC